MGKKYHYAGVQATNPLVIPHKHILTELDRVDWNSLFMLLILTVSAAVMWVMLLLSPGTTWVAQVPSTAIEVMGSFMVLLLAVFLVARYKDQPGTFHVSAGLAGVVIFKVFSTVAPANSNEYVWLHTSAGVLRSRPDPDMVVPAVPAAGCLLPGGNTLDLRRHRAVPEGQITSDERRQWVFMCCFLARS